ncbi:hypothetical protein [Flavobacterium aestivum]|uniref:hypothetical protein n=1 Tax=Flavobacterium aestivum TaxID=3003257 RepID=UPI0024830BFC|nr:hypothetical protein [Flavobacterium aestivum]
MNKKGLRSPAITKALTSPEGQKLGFTVLKVALIGTVFGIAYYKLFMGFKPLRLDPRYAPSSINDSQAKARAEAIYTALLGMGANYPTVENNLSGLNHNAFIKIINAFGERRSSTLSKLTLVEWLQDQFNEKEIAKLRFLIKGFF